LSLEKNISKERTKVTPIFGGGLQRWKLRQVIITDGTDGKPQAFLILAKGV
jgi:hypothetical protein